MQIKINGDVIGERKLIMAILNQALADALLFKKPRSPKQIPTVRKRVKIKQFRTFMFSFEETVMYMEMINAINRHLYNKKIQIQLEKNSFEARNFFNKSNEVLKTFCHLIDIDPDYICEKANKYFHDHDHKLAA